jgi:hypothetical protein
MEVGSVADVSDIHAASIFRVDVSRMSELVGLLSLFSRSLNHSSTHSYSSYGCYNLPSSNNGTTPGLTYVWYGGGPLLLYVPLQGTA